MPTKQITQKLTRFAKVAERIQKELVLREAKLIDALKLQSASCIGFDISARRAVEQADKALGQEIREFVLLSEAYSTIRKELAKANARVGVTDALANLNRMSKLAELNVRLSQSTQAFDIDEATRLAEKMVAAHVESTNHYGRQPGEVEFLPFHRERLEALAAEAARLRRETDSISDELATLNGNTVTVDLDAEVVELMKLA